MAGFTHPHKKLGWAEFCKKISSNVICTHECKNAENEERKKRKNLWQEYSWTIWPTKF